MSQLLRLARPADLDRLLPMVAAHHAEAGIASDDDDRRAAVLPLLEGSPYGAVYLMGPARAPVGYLCVTFGWSADRGGMEGRVAALFVRPPVRRRGIATEALSALIPRLGEAGVTALQLEIAAGNDTAARLFARLGFREATGGVRMTRGAQQSG